MTKTAKVEAVKTDAESTVKSLFKVVDAKAKAEGYVTSARDSVKKAADTVVSKAEGLRNGADQAVDVLAAGANAGVKGAASLGHHIVDASYANLATTADMVKNLAGATCLSEAYKVEADYVRTIVKQNFNQLTSGFTLLRNAFSGTVKAAQDQRKTAA